MRFAACVCAVASPLVAQFEFPSEASTHVVEVTRARLDRLALDPEAGLAFVRVRVGTHELSCIFDTGAGACVLSKRAARRLELEANGSINALGSGGAVPAPTYSIEALHIPTADGNALLQRNVRAIGLDLRTIERSVGRTVDGIVGSQLFRKTPFTLDLQRARILVHRPASFSPPKDVKALRLEFLLGIPSLRLRVFDTRARRFLVDTGNAATLLLHGPFVARTVTQSTLDTLPAITGRGIGKASSHVYYARLEQAEIGPLRLRDLPVGLGHPDERGLLGNRTISGNLGSGLLARGRWTFDYSSARCWIEPERARAHRIDATLGVYLEKRDSDWGIRRVLAQSPAAEAGLRARDTLLTIDGKPVPETLAALEARLAEATADGRSCRIGRRAAKGGAESEVEVRVRRWLPALRPEPAAKTRR